MYTDKLGVYRIGDLKFYSKLDAIQMHTATGHHPHWDFNEAVFSSYDWRKEPTQHILDLYRARAQQLRDKYDYLILSYSGGADSTTVLESFIDNGIHLDEVAIQTNLSKSDNKQDYMNAELFNVALPRIADAQAKCPGLKQRIIDLTELELEYFKKPDAAETWLHELNCLMSPHGVARESLGLKVKEWADMIHAGKKLAIITGTDKPRLFQHPDGRFSFRFIDIIDGSTTVKSISGQQPYADEFFFWTPDMPEIAIKQAHLVKNFVLDPASLNSPFFNQDQNAQVLLTVTVNGQKKLLTNHGLHSIIYPKWNTSTFTVGKPASNIFSPRDDWILKLSDDHYLRKNWHYGINKWWSMLPDYWKNDPTDPAKGIKLCISKDYFLS